MASMDQAVAKVSALGTKISGNKYLQSISAGSMSILPAVIVGAFASLLAGIPIPAYREFIASSGIAPILGFAVNGTTNMLGLYMTFGITRALGEKLGHTSPSLPILTVVSYMLLMPVGATENGVAFITFDYLGAKGMILGIVLAMLVSKLYDTIVKKNIVIKMPAGTPDYVANNFVSLIPAFAIVIVAGFIRAIFSMTPWGDVFSCFYSVIQIPLQGIVGNNIVSVLIVCLLMNGLWIFGIHPGFMTGVIGPLYMTLDAANQAAYAAGAALPNIIGMNFNYIATVAIAYPAVPIAILIAARSVQLRTIGKVGLVPGVFGINEPIIFGLPVILNPLAAIPFVFCPMINIVAMYFLQSTGIVATCIGMMPFNIPMCVTGMLSGGWTIAVAEVALLIVNVLIWIPFIKTLDRTHLAEETA